MPTVTVIQPKITEEKMEEAINRADELLYYGKEHGRDQIVMESREEES